MYSLADSALKEYDDFNNRNFDSITKLHQEEVKQIELQLQESQTALAAINQELQIKTNAFEIKERLLTEKNSQLKSTLDANLETNYSNLIGKGSYAQVYKLSTPVAVKQFVKEPPAFLQIKPTEEKKKFALRQTQNFNKEKNILLKLNDKKNLSKLKGESYIPKIFSWCKKSLSISLEFFSQGPLSRISPEIPFSKTGHQTRITFMLQIAKALAYIHSLKIAHLDVKPDNILIDQDARAKLADFGESHDFSKKQPLPKGPIGSYPYMAPELLNGEEISAQNDLFSYAVVSWELFSKQKPYAQMGASQQPHLIGNFLKTRRLPMPEICEKIPGIKDLITNCWLENPVERPDANQVVEQLLKPDLLAQIEDEKELNGGNIGDTESELSLSQFHSLSC